MASSEQRLSSASAASQSRYSMVAMVLHWLIAVAIMVAIVLGWRMEGPPGPQTFALYQLHKSVGITILLLTVARIGWRLCKPPPPLPASLTPAERLAAHTVHLALYVLLIGLPLTGWLIVSSSERAIPTVLFGQISWPHLPGLDGMPATGRKMVNSSAEFGHETLVKLAYALVALHVLGALKHQFIDRTAHFTRMLPVAPRHSATALVAALVLVTTAGLATQFYSPATPPSVVAAPPAAPLAPGPSAPVGTGRSATAMDASPTNMVAPVDAEPSIDAAATPARWSVDRAGSEIAFATSYSGTPVAGSFAAWTADIDFSPDALGASAVRVTIDLASLQTANSDAASMLPGADWFSTDAFPKAVFVADRFRSLGGNRYEAVGRLTLRGQTHPQILRFTLRIRGDVATMTGSTGIDRTRFGVGQGDWGSTAALAADVPVTIRITAMRQR